MGGGGERGRDSGEDGAGERVRNLKGGGEVGREEEARRGEWRKDLDFEIFGPFGKDSGDFVGCCGGTFEIGSHGPFSNWRLLPIGGAERVGAAGWPRVGSFAFRRGAVGGGRERRERMFFRLTRPSWIGV